MCPTAPIFRAALKGIHVSAGGIYDPKSNHCRFTVQRQKPDSGARANLETQHMFKVYPHLCENIFNLAKTFLLAGNLQPVCFTEINTGITLKSNSIKGWTDVSNGPKITLACFSRLQCHLGIKGICSSIKTQRMEGIK